mmetsp:Transcript_23259/g.43727  ORF Transcript_23259/g.43727 Transcript_23259/m.43727 type:complete len:207 (+) Transcript_23259:45-665(+)
MVRLGLLTLCFLTSSLVGAATVTCPNDAVSESSFVGTNFCPDGQEVTVGPGMLAASRYDVAAFYFGAQYCGICKEKLKIMYSAWERLPAEQRERVLVAGFGLRENAAHNLLFCHKALSSTVADELWNDWDITQRDMVILTRSESGTWQSYCKFSMNFYADDFEDVLRHVASSSGNSSSFDLGAISSSFHVPISVVPVAVAALASVS